MKINWKETSNSIHEGYQYKYKKNYDIHTAAHGLTEAIAPPRTRTRSLKLPVKIVHFGKILLVGLIVYLPLNIT